MLMTEQLTPLAQRILAILQESGDWMTRREIGRLLGRDGSMNQHDVRTTEDMVRDGLVERDDRVTGTVQKAVHYRAIKQ